MTFKTFLFEERFHDYFDKLFREKKISAVNYGKHGWFTVYLILETPKEMEELEISPGKIVPGNAWGDYKKVTDACEKIANNAQKAGMRKQRGFLLIKSTKMKENDIESGGYAHPSYRHIVIEKNSLKNNEQSIFEVIAHEWAHTVLFNLPKHVKEEFKKTVKFHKDKMKSIFAGHDGVFYLISDSYKQEDFKQAEKHAIFMLSEFIGNAAGGMASNAINTHCPNSILTMEETERLTFIFDKIKNYSKNYNVDFFKSYVIVISKMLKDGTIARMSEDTAQLQSDLENIVDEYKGQFEKIISQNIKDVNVYHRILDICYMNMIANKILYQMSDPDFRWNESNLAKNINDIYDFTEKYYDDIHHDFEKYEKERSILNEFKYRSIGKIYHTLRPKLLTIQDIDVKQIITTSYGEVKDYFKNIVQQKLIKDKNLLKLRNFDIFHEDLLEILKLPSFDFPNHGSEYIKKKESNEPVIKDMQKYAKQNNLPSGYSLCNEDELWAESVEALITGKPLDKKLKMLVINNL